MQSPDTAREERLSPWVRRHVTRIAAGGRVLDVACGAGRHARFLASRGYAVTAVDRDTARLAADPGRVTDIRTADLEAGAWPFEARQFDGIVVVNYLHRPRLDALARSLADGGVLIYDTFAAGNGRFGRPRNPDYLLRPGELLEQFSDGFELIAYRHGEVAEPAPAMRQSLCARRQDARAATAFRR